MAIQINITNEGLAKIRSVMDGGSKITVDRVECIDDDRGGVVVATLPVEPIGSVEQNSDTFRFTVQDKSDAEYVCHRVRVYDTDSVVIAESYRRTVVGGGTADPFFTKHAASEMLVGFELHFEGMTVRDYFNVGDVTFNLDSATTETEGVIELATEAEAKAGTDAKRAITPKTLKAKLLEYLPLVGGVMTGNIQVNKDEFVLCKANNTGLTVIRGGGSIAGGASFALYGAGYAYSEMGAFRIIAHNGKDAHNLYGYPDGRLTWDGKNILRSVNGTAADAAGNVVIPLKFLPLAGGTMEGTIKFSKNEEQKVYVDDNGDLLIGGNYGGLLRIRGANSEDNPRGFQIRAGEADGVNVYLIGKPDGTLTWGGSQALLPAGAVFAFAANTTPSGCLICNGAAVSRTTYARLFAAIGTTYGSGDGSTTFNLPNLTDRFIQGNGTAGTYIEAGLPDHNHTVSSWGAYGYIDADKSEGMGGYTATTSKASASNPIYGKSNTVQPPALTMRYYIKY